MDQPIKQSEPPACRQLVCTEKTCTAPKCLDWQERADHCQRRDMAEIPDWIRRYA